MTKFLSDDNIKLMWDVISEQNVFLLLSYSNKTKIYSIFQTNVKPYYNEKKKTVNDLMTLNKEYIKLVIKSISILHSQTKINEFNTNKLVTHEDIHNDKLSKFDDDLNKITEDFNNAIKLKIPNKPEFEDKTIDNPITEMEEKLKEMTAQRNYDIQQINNDTNVDVIKDWLKPIETSVKVDKNSDNINTFLNTNNKLKHLNQEQSKMSSLKTNKMVSFTEVIDNDNQPNYNILNKLKKIDTVFKDDNERISIIEENIKQINNKIEIILSLLKDNKKE
jgi:hypothetical protein